MYRQTGGCTDEQMDRQTKSSKTILPQTSNGGCVGVCEVGGLKKSGTAHTVSLRGHTSTGG